MMIQLFSAQTASEVSLSVLSTEALINWCHCFPKAVGSDTAVWDCNTFHRGCGCSPGLWHTVNLSEAIPNVDVPFNWGWAFWSAVCRCGLWGCYCIKASEKNFREGKGGSTEGNSVIHSVLWLKRNSVFPKAEHVESEKRGAERTFVIQSVILTAGRIWKDCGLPVSKIRDLSESSSSLKCYWNSPLKETVLLQYVFSSVL